MQVTEALESMASVNLRRTNVPSWEKVGKDVEGSLTSAQAIVTAGLDWRVLEKKVYIDTNGVEGLNVRRVPKHKALVKSNDDVILSVVKDSYHPLQNTDAFKFFDPFIESGLATFESAGSLKGGRIIWVLAALNKAPVDVGGGDVVNKYLLLANGHDAKLSTHVAFAPNRFVCSNAMARTLNASEYIRIRHSSKAQDALKSMQEAVNAMDAAFDITAAQYQFMASRTINPKDLERYVNTVFKLVPDGNEIEKSRHKKMQEDITRLFENGAGSFLKTAKGTYWGAYNAVTNWLTHESGSNRVGADERRLYNNWFGDLARKNTDAFVEALKV
jgi:phage/plasmid-like protein (TIGR03299 family)